MPPRASRLCSADSVAALLLALTACRHEPAPGELPAAAVEGPAAPGEADEGGAQAPEPPARALFFAGGPGREAILARERRDHAAARELLETLLAGGPAPDERGAASFLLGLELARARKFAAAAEAFAAARTAPALAPVAARLAVHEARARLDAGDVEGALAALGEAAPPGQAPALIRRWTLARADALARSEREDEARALYRELLATGHLGRTAHEVRSKLATLLEASGGRDDLKAAQKLWDRLALDVPLSDYGAEAREHLARLDRKLGPLRRGKAARVHDRTVRLATIRALIARRRYDRARKEAAKLRKKGRLTRLQACELAYLEGRAIFKQRKRAEARVPFGRAAKLCRKAGAEAEGFLVKSRYQAARGEFAAGAHAKAARAFEALAKEHDAHTYADDAWLLAGESWQEAGDLARARAAYEKVALAGGDMANEGWRRVALLALAAGDAEAARVALDAAIERGVAPRRERARAHYLRARAADLAGREADARADYVAAVEAEPVGYVALLALSRLRERGEEEAGLGVLARAPGEVAPKLTPPDTPGVARARLLARLGLGEAAAEELDAAGVEGWPAAALLDQAGAWPAALRRVANLGDGWRGQPPTDPDWRRVWQVAYPAGFAELADPVERAEHLPARLLYGFMQTESRFDPGATSWAGARGLVQLMPSTARDVAEGMDLQLGDDDALYLPETNLRLAARHIHDLLESFGGGEDAPVLAAPAYNAGAGAVRRWLRERGAWDLDLFVEAIPYDETRRYVQSVLGRWMAHRFLYEPGPTADRVPHLPLRRQHKAPAQPGGAGGAGAK